MCFRDKWHISLAFALPYFDRLTMLLILSIAQAAQLCKVLEVNDEVRRQDYLTLLCVHFSMSPCF